MRKLWAGIMIFGLGAGMVWLFQPQWTEVTSNIPVLSQAVKEIQGLNIVRGDTITRDDVPALIAKHLKNRDTSFQLTYKLDVSKIEEYQQLPGKEKKEQISEMIDQEFKKLFDLSLREDEYLEHVIEKYTCKWTYSDWTKEVTLYFDEIVYRESKEETEMVEQAAAVEVEKLIKPGMSDYKKVKKIHDFIVNHVTYTLVDEGRKENTAYSALFSKESACYGYSMLAYIMLQHAGIESHIVTGKAITDPDDKNPVGHAWNLVKVDGHWYHMDVTFDDPIGPSDDQKPFYDYFLISDKEIKKNHFWSKEEQKYDMPEAKRSYPR